MNEFIHVGTGLEKSTHISMISNSVTHLWSYTNSAIAGSSAAISPETPRELQYCHAEHPCLCTECRYRRIEWRVFRDVSQFLKSVSWCFTSGSRCFTNVSWFYYVLWCLVTIVEETLTSDENVSLFLISILNMYIWNFNICVPIRAIFKEKHTNC